MQRYVQQLVDRYAAVAKTRDDAAAAAAELRREEARLRGGPNPERNPFKEWDGDPEDLPEGENLFDVDEETNDGAFDEYISRVEEFTGPQRVIAEVPLGEYIGVDVAELPPVDNLSDEEAEELYEALNYLGYTFGHSFFLDHVEVPYRFMYRAMVDLLGETVKIVPGDTVYGCQYWAPGCRLGRYCGCFSAWSKEHYIADGGDPDMPQECFPELEELKRGFPEFYDPDSSEYKQVERQRARQKRDEARGVIPKIDPMNPDNLPFGREDSRYRPRPDFAELQDVVDEWIQDTGVRYFSELTNTAILAEEVGEVARLAARRYGEQSFKTAEAAGSAEADWADELSDVLFVLTCLANQTGVDLTEAFAKGMAKRNTRDADRHRGNEKLR